MPDKFILHSNYKPTGDQPQAIEALARGLKEGRRDQVLLADQELRGQRRNDALVGTVREVMVEGPSKRNKSRFSGRDSGNRIVVWEDDGGTEIGSFVNVRITEAHPQILLGELVCS